MNPRFAGWPETNDFKWFGIRKGWDLPEEYWQEFMQEYKPMWDSVSYTHLDVYKRQPCARRSDSRRWSCPSFA